MKRVHWFRLSHPPRWQDQYLSAFLPVQPQSVVPLWYARHAANVTIDCCGGIFLKKKSGRFPKTFQIEKKIPILPKIFPRYRKTIHSSSRVCCFRLASSVSIWTCLWVLSQHLLVEGLILCHGFREGIFKCNSCRIHRDLILTGKKQPECHLFYKFQMLWTSIWAMENIDLANPGHASPSSSAVLSCCTTWQDKP